MNPSDDSLWYKEAIIYQLHVRCFFDSDGDGIGDFRGLVQKLDYISDLGVTAIWLLPFYPSPLKDDGYDISDYTDVHPAYGTLRDLQLLLDEAHRRGLRVITELVINHTSDQHPWFQAARQAPPGSPQRDFYVWSDADSRFPETRIIFTDTESSNWAWDPVAKQYYWHRFFSHQPDLNHNNPDVVEAVNRVMCFWLDAGVDGLRLDAIPYLCVREGTNNENLPETHDVLKRLRGELDGRYPGRMLLAEANQWPEDACQYFGSGDECHMAFHFPLMPRIYMAVAQQDRHPITEIVRQTPPIPELCQWAIFLRNHDELTLEMVTDRERDYMYSVYAADPRMRVNVGIRRRLAPLMDNDRPKIELLNSLLMSMPGTPIIYYGDELGMGDNIYLGDRNGVRTPMQWSGDRNAGFSRADPAQLYLPPIMDPVYGYQAVSVEAQTRSSGSVLNWMRRLIAVRKAHPAFGRGTMEVLYPTNRKILAYLRELADESILCVANLAPSAQPVELDLGRFNGRVPVEMMGRTPFPPIGDLPYLLTLPGHGFYWFRLAQADQLDAWLQSDDSDPKLPELPCVILPVGRELQLPEAARRQLEREALPGFVAQQRWFAAKGAPIERVEIVEQNPWGEEGQWMLTLLQVVLADRPPQVYFLPLATVWDDEDAVHAMSAFVVARVRRGARSGVLYDAFGAHLFVRALAHAVGQAEPSPFGRGTLTSTATSAYRDLAVDSIVGARHPELEQSNTSVVLDERLILKGYRRLLPGINPDVEVGRFLTEVAQYPNTPPLAGALEFRGADDTVYTLALLQGYVDNQGNGWAQTLDHLESYLRLCLEAPEADAGEAADLHASFLASMRLLGVRTGQLHQTLAQSHGAPAFDPEPVSADEMRSWVASVRDAIPASVDRLRGARERLTEALGAQADSLLAAQEALEQQVSQWERFLINELTGEEAVGVLKMRLHGDFHLGQVLVVEHDFQLVDFEGEVDLPLEERRRKHSPLRDLAGMLRSINYAAYAALFRLLRENGEAEEQLRRWCYNWEVATAAAFRAGYDEATQGCAAIPQGDVARALVGLFLLQKALYELRYELDHRPDWIGIPIAGILALVKDGQ